MPVAADPPSTGARHISARIEASLGRLASVVSWVWLALILVIAFAVVLRFVFGIGRIELEELQWHLYAIGFLMGIVACAIRDRHVRVDVFRDRMSPRLRDWIDFYGILLLQVPFLLLVLWSALPFVADSFTVAERSGSAGGLPLRWLLKSVLPISFALLALATFVRFCEVAKRLFVDESAGERS
jgi:TRAP-type mannitol/chloroaromatic compound transport system permease small subunit